MDLNQLYSDHQLLLTKARRTSAEKVDAGRPKIGGENPELRVLPEKDCRFEVYRADEIRTSSLLFAGGDWHWRLSDATGQVLVEAGGYRSEGDCRQAIAMLQRHVPRALFPTSD